MKRKPKEFPDNLPGKIVRRLVSQAAYDGYLDGIEFANARFLKAVRRFESDTSRWLDEDPALVNSAEDKYVDRSVANLLKDFQEILAEEEESDAAGLDRNQEA